MTRGGRMASARIPGLRALAAALVLLLIVCGTAPAAPPPRSLPPHVPGEVLIKFKPGVPASDRASLRGQMRATRKRSFRGGAEHWRLGAGTTTEEAIAKLRGHPSVLYVEPDYILTASIAPNDPHYARQWGLNNTGQTGGQPGADIHAEAAWDLTTGGRSVLVAVIDTGVDLQHPDLQANIWTNP